MLHDLKGFPPLPLGLLNQAHVYCCGDLRKNDGIKQNDAQRQRERGKRHVKTTERFVRYGDGVGCKGKKGPN